MDSKEKAAVDFREKKIKEVMGVYPNIINPGKEPSLVRSVAPLISKSWGTSNYANPLTNTIGILGYEPGDRPYLEAHEAGHLSNEQAGLPKLFGVSGRAVTGISDQLGNPGPLELLGGGLTYAFDASEEDRAERLSAKYGPQLGGKPHKAPQIDDQGRSRYGDSLRDEGSRRMTRAAKPLIDSFNFLKNKIQRVHQGGMEPDIRNAVSNYRSLSKSVGDDITPQFLEASKNMDKLRDEYKSRGGDFDTFVSNIK